jgi:DNA-binding beta-propeller fold protein YncE
MTVCSPKVERLWLIITRSALNSRVFLIYVCCLFLLVGACATPENIVHRSLPDSSLAWPPPPQNPRIQYVRSVPGQHDSGAHRSWLKRAAEAMFGKEEKENKMLDPYGVFADSERLYVTDPGLGLVHIFDLNDEGYFDIRDAHGQDLVSPIGIAVDNNGEIFISDSMLRKILVFDKTGKYLREIGEPELFKRPTGIAVDEDRIYVVDTHGHQVLVFSKKDGAHLFSFGKRGTAKGEFNYPTNIFIGRDKMIYITDSMNFRVQIFDRNGNSLSAFGKLGDGSGDFSKPKGIAVDSEGHIYVVDAHFDNVQIFDKKGRLLLSNVSPGRYFHR